MSDNEKTTQPASTDSTEPAYRYNAALAQDIEGKWQKIWDDKGTFWAANVNGDLKDGKGRNADGRPAYFAMDMFPYPSGKGLHVGHPLGYLASDVVSRYHRMKGENVLHAMGYDAFGLPAEQYAVQTGQHPRVTTLANIANMSRQLHRMGLSFDDRRSFATIDPGYVRWTQWIFSRIYDSWYDEDAVNPSGSKGSARPVSELVAKFESGEKAIPGHESDGKAWADLDQAEQQDILNDFRLAYISKSPVNWCPGLGTVLANEEVTAEGKSERGNFPVFQRELRQWSMRITKYGHRLIEDLDGIDWPEKVKLMQRNWIGESHGASVHFTVATADGSKDMEIYTTRPDTLFGTTFAVVSPEHHLLENVPAEWPADVPEDWKGGFATPVEAVKAYRLAAEAKTAKDRVDEGGEKTGLFTGLYATNPITGAKLPLFTADYVLMDYGTGAIMAVPGGDQRDYDFAVKFGLPVIYTVKPLPESGDDLANYEGKKTEGVDVTFWDRDELLRHEPHVSDKVIACLNFNGDAKLNPMRLCFGLAELARQKGAKAFNRTAVTGITVKNGAVQSVETSSGSIATKKVVLASGVWTPGLGDMVGVKVPIRPRQGQILVTERLDGLVSKNYAEFGYLAAKSGKKRPGVTPEMEQFGVAMVLEPSAAGTVLIGSSRRFVGMDTTPHPAVMQAIAQRAKHFFPSFSGVKLIRAYAGVRPASPDGKPIISPTHVEGVYVAAGHEGNGIGLSLITGKLVSQMLRGETPLVDLAPLCIDRFGMNPPSLPSA